MSDRRRRFKRGLLLLLLIAACTAIWFLRPYPPDQTALKAMQGGEGITVTDYGEWIVFEGGQSFDPSVIFYPGARVKPESYAPLARLLAGYGHRVFIARMPFNLAVADVQRADELLKNFPDQPFVIGGHSMGGAMAARYAAFHADRFSGVFFLAAFPDKRGDLSQTKLPVLSLLGTRDGIVDPQKFKAGKSLLPTQAVYMSIEGGNHSQFGSYGMQEGDYQAIISAQDQWQQTAAALEQWMLQAILR